MLKILVTVGVDAVEVERILSFERLLCGESAEVLKLTLEAPVWQTVSPDVTLRRRKKLSQICKLDTDHPMNSMYQNCCT